MKLDPAAVPFWEQERGGGPVTEWMRARRRIEAKHRLDWLTAEIRSIRATAEVQLALRTLPALEAERDALREELGLLRLVRGAA